MSNDITRTLLSTHPTARKRERERPAERGPTARAVISCPMSFFSISFSCPVMSSSKCTSSPPLNAITTWRWLRPALVMLFFPGGFHSCIRRSALICRIPLGCICNRESSPSKVTAMVGEVARKPLSVTSSTVSPMESTSVALRKDTTMYLSNSSFSLLFTVHTAEGLPGSSETAISVTVRPWRRIRRVERMPRPHAAKNCLVSSPNTSATLKSIIGARDSMSSVSSRFLGWRGLKYKYCGGNMSPPSPCICCCSRLDDSSGASSSSPIPWNWYSAWLPNSAAANRKPCFMTQMEFDVGMVSKYLTLTSFTTSVSLSVSLSHTSVTL
mmetsp:Transcript_33157/g.53759  ORF Transcript_33157/g.53759 Transcript_33157/m.53759 type:complete len:326 (-) Transcript_33157:926-1903(-)